MTNLAVGEEVREMNMQSLGEYKEIKLEQEGPLAVLTLNRPNKMNAFTGLMMLEIIDAFDKTDTLDEIRAVIVTGSGDRAFCAGADLSLGGDSFDYNKHAEHGAPNNVVNLDYRRDGGGRVSLRIFDSMKPVIGAINGAAVGVGATMLLPMDIRLASTSARFGFVFNRRGVSPEAASGWFLPRLVGIQQALEWCYSGRIFSADEAKQGGLIHSLHAEDELLAAAKAMGLEIAENTASVSTALTRHMMWRMLGAVHPMDAHIVDSAALYSRGQTEDAREGVISFLEKRKPEFPNKISDSMPNFFPWWKNPNFEWIGD